MALSSAAIEESVTQYFELQRREAEGHVEDPERALAQLRELEAAARRSLARSGARSTR